MVEPYETDDDDRLLDDDEEVEETTTTNDQSDHNKKENQNKIRLYRIAKQIHEKEDIFVDQYHTPYAFVKINDHMEVLDVYSLRFQHWVYRKLIWYDNDGRAILPEPADVTRILDYLKAHAEFDAVQKVLHLRVAAGDDDTNNIYYDLSSPLWEAIKITPQQGWLVEKTPTMMFRRYKNQTAQVYPSREYPDDIFDRFINLINVKNEDSKLLLKCYIIALLIPDIPKAILMLHGEPNSAKTTLLELIKMLIDPCSTRTLTFRKENDELAQLFSHNYLPYFDNLSYISDWMSDAFCRAATGDSFSKRKLYTDNDDIFYTFMRCIGFSGVNLAATKSDLLDRGLIIELERISSDSQRQIKKIWKDFDDMKPQLLGYIFDILAKVLNMRQTSHIDIKGLPRLADWAEACELISRCLGYKDNQFIETFRRNIKLQNEAAIEDSAIAQTIISFMEDKETWQGTSTELLGILEALAPTLSINTKNHKIWPSKPNVLTRRLKYLISNLKEFDIIVRPGDNSTTKNRTLCIEKKKVVQSSILPIHRYDMQNHAQISSDNSINMDNSIDTRIDTPQISIPENLQIHAQNGSGIDGIDGIDILQGNSIEETELCVRDRDRDKEGDDYNNNNLLNLNDPKRDHIDDDANIESQIGSGRSDSNEMVHHQPLVSVEEFFYDNPVTSWKPLPTHTLEQSPCCPVLGSKEEYGRVWYYCKLHPKDRPLIDLSSVEQHCKFKDPELHKAEIVRLTSPTTTADASTAEDHV